jgi:hypothetical protein
MLHFYAKPFQNLRGLKRAPLCIPYYNADLMKEQDPDPMEKCPHQPRKGFSHCRVKLRAGDRLWPPVADTITAQGIGGARGHRRWPCGPGAGP